MTHNSWEITKPKFVFKSLHMKSCLGNSPSDAFHEWIIGSLDSFMFKKYYAYLFQISEKQLDETKCTDN